ncbi:MAG: cob(I)yrinic acid a,c-diamide adenosyltransferase [Tannerellaceae bacterium]|nr:cob(I)yrinic acid a,c-diamide adenosyltransferase [Tannerellaceae bacterium]
MTKIYTRSGDKGKTKIHGGERVEKDDIRIEANGTLDELNSLLGVIRAFLLEDHTWQASLFRIQKEMMVVMSHVATPDRIRPVNPNTLDESIIHWCEEQIDHLTARMEDSNYFILPGGNLVSSHLQLARTVARRAERRLWTLNRLDPVPDSILRFINRLSDLLFTMGRYEMFSQGKPEEKWQNFLYKKKSFSGK